MGFWEDRKHLLKTDPFPFDAVYRGEKRFEVRKHDRDFQVEHWLVLREHTVEGGYTGRYLAANITYILSGGQYGLPSDICVISLGNVLQDEHFETLTGEKIDAESVSNLTVEGYKELWMKNHLARVRKPRARKVKA